MTVRKKIDWRLAAERLGEAVPIGRLHPAVLEWAAASPSKQAWAVGFSGGADSLALLLLLYAHWPAKRKKLRGLHFNHQLRGAAAERDEQFCRKVCRSLGIEYRTARWTTADAPTSEAQARTARHRFFVTELKRLRTQVLWLGHQQDDVAETMLMRLARGSGTAGLAAPRPVQLMPEGRVHLRPLLMLKKAEIARVLKAEGVPWREDASNAGSKFLRNRTRTHVVPAWIKANGERDAVAGAALSRELLDEDDTALEKWLTELNPITAEGHLNLRRLSGKPRALVRRALHRWLAKNVERAALSRQAFNALLNDLLVQRITRHSLGPNEFAEIGKTRLRLRSVPRKLSN
jgi:tRNA(Ile)-lysidine synthase